MLDYLSQNLELLNLVPWFRVGLGTLIAYGLGALWYGFWFKKPYMELIQNKSARGNRTAMVIKFLSTATLAYLIGIFTLFEEAFLLLFDALIGVILLSSLAETLFRCGNNRQAVRYWLITAGYELVSVLVITAVIFLF